MKFLIALKLSVAILISLFVLLLFSHKSLEKAELTFYDWRLCHSYVPEETPEPLVIVGVTQDFEKKVGEPFSRKFYTDLLKTLKTEGASVAGFDIFFPQIADRKTDEPFIRILHEGTKTVLPVFSPTRLEEKDGMYYVSPEIRGSAEDFNRAAASLGHINTIPDRDQVVRKAPALLKVGGRTYPQISLEMARIYNKQDRIRIAYPGFTVPPGTVPVTRDGDLYIKFLSREAVEKYFVAFEDVITGDYPAGKFKNKAVLIGQTMVGAKNSDLIPTPWGTEFGVLLQTSILHDALSGRYIYRLDRSVISLFVLLTGILMGFVVFSLNMFANTVLFAGFSGFLTLFSLHAMRKTGLFLDVIPFFVLSFSLYFASLVYSLVNAVQKLLKKERSIRVMQDVEKEITSILNPADLPGITDGITFPGFEGTELIKQTPDITIGTLMASFGIEAGAFIMLPTPEKYQIIASHGELMSGIDMKKVVNAAFRKKDPIIINKLPGKNEWGQGIRNLMLLPVISHASFTILGLFINKNPAPFSKTSVFVREDVPIMESLSLQSMIAIQNARLNIALKETQLESIFRLSVAIEYRDRETGMHIHRVSEYSGVIAERIGLGSKEVELIKSAMPLHDIGKIAIPDSILLKPGKLTPEERKVVEQHPVIGARMLEGSNSLILKVSEIIALYHHEKYNGSGYPYHLKGNSIPLYGRIAAIADIFDAMSSKRVYKEAVEFDESFAFLKKESGTIFDPMMVEAFINEADAIKKIKSIYKDTEDTALM